MRPPDFWQLTFAEFQALYEAIVGPQEEPFTKEDSLDLQDAWAAKVTGKVNGNT